MKKVLVMCIAVSFIATACDWFKKPTDTTVVTTVDDQDSLSAIDTTTGKTDNTVSVKDSAKEAGKKI